jgi:hypothetical protein
MSEAGILNVYTLGIDSLEEDVKTYRREFDNCNKSYARSYKFNQRLSISFTALSIVLTMLTAIVAVYGDTPNISFDQKVWVGILGAASVAVQTAAKQFPVEVRSKRYLELGNAVRELVLDLSLVENIDDLKKIKAKYVEILKLENTIP